MACEHPPEYLNRMKRWSPGTSDVCLFREAADLTARDWIRSAGRCRASKVIEEWSGALVLINGITGFVQIGKLIVRTLLVVKRTAIVVSLQHIQYTKLVR